MARPPATSRELIDGVALDLFLTRGFAAVTGDQLAAACGVSRPTLFRYVSQTANIVLDQVAAFGRLTVERLHDHPGPPWTALAAALLESYAELDDEHPMGKAFAVLRAEPDLRGRSGLLTRSWRADLARELRARGVEDPVVGEAMAASAIGIVTAAFAHRWSPAQLEHALAVCRPAGSA